MTTELACDQLEPADAVDDAEATSDDEPCCDRSCWSSAWRCWPRRILACLSGCRAQVQVHGRERSAGQPPVEQDADEEAEANDAVQLASPSFVMNDDQFDQWVFGGPRNSRAGRNKLDSLLTLQVDDVAQDVQPVRDAEEEAGAGRAGRYQAVLRQGRGETQEVRQGQDRSEQDRRDLPGAGPPPGDPQFGALQRRIVLREDPQEGAQPGGGRAVPEGRPGEEAVPLSGQGRAGRRLSSTRPSASATTSGGSSWS